MAKCCAAELIALEEAGPLLRFAAEKVTDLDPNLSLAIAEARAAADSDQWTPDVSQKFWVAFSKLCDLIKPVTISGLSIASHTIETKTWTGGTKKISLPERTSRRYMTALILLVLLILPLQLYVWTCTNLSKYIDDTMAVDIGSMEQLEIRFAILLEQHKRLKSMSGENPNTPADATTPPTEDSENSEQKKATLIEESERQPESYRPLRPEEQVRATQLTVAANNLGNKLDKLLYLSYLLDHVRRLDPTPITENIIELNQEEWDEAFQYTSGRKFEVETFVYKSQQFARLIVGIIGGYILPILFGAAGAIASAIRDISNQIQYSTFVPSSPIRHLMRVSLGAFAGIVVGLFTGLTGQLSLPPMAIAFLAGYGVDALFSMFDEIIQRFRQSQA